jgi:hypothetical protein
VASAAVTRVRSWLITRSSLNVKGWLGLRGYITLNAVSLPTCGDGERRHGGQRGGDARAVLAHHAQLVEREGVVPGAALVVQPQLYANKFQCVSLQFNRDFSKVSNSSQEQSSCTLEA